VRDDVDRRRGPGRRARRAAATSRPVWVSWTVADDRSGRLRSGETVAEAVAALEGVGVAALLVNCSTPESVAPALAALGARAGGRPFGAYANGFEAIAPGDDVADGAAVPPAREDLDPERYADHAARWLDAGAQVVGGCCEVGPAHIARLRRLLDGRGA